MTDAIVAASGTGSTLPVKSKSTRLAVIDVAKGVGIFLVVVGHLVAVRTEGPPAYAVLKTLIYNFHMPFFMFVSGFTFERFMRNQRNRAFYPFLVTRADRLLIPFFVSAAIIIGAKALASQFVAVDDNVVSLSSALSHVFFDTDHSPALSIWYVFVLFIFSVLTFPFVRSGPRALLWMIPMSFVLYNLDLTDDFYLNRCGMFYLFFLAGMAFSVAYESLDLKGSTIIILLAVAFACASAVAINENVNSKDIMILVSFPAIPLLISISAQMTGHFGKVFSLLGRYSMAIYLFNTLVIGAMKFVVFKLLGGDWFVTFTVAATVAGLLVPIVIANLAKRLAPPVAKYLV